ncbi:MAG: hypothetical protein LBI27_02225 [Clostridiales bacterium]|jgi:Leucine-rich repeat (LRR) protein|nr:hypothetical protein [Clostridiales bacterium]
MKKKIAFIFILLTAACFMLIPAYADDPEECPEDLTACFTDEIFLGNIRKELGREIDSNDAITRDDLKEITSLDVEDARIYSVAGIEHLSGLTELYIRRSAVDELNLSYNSALTELQINDTCIRELSVIQLPENFEKDNFLTTNHCPHGNEADCLAVRNNEEEKREEESEEPQGEEHEDEPEGEGETSGGEEAASGDEEGGEGGRGIVQIGETTELPSAPDEGSDGSLLESILGWIFIVFTVLTFLISGFMLIVRIRN